MISWVFGASAIGKKTFIRTIAAISQFTGGPTYVPMFIEDGEIELHKLVSGYPLVRWQWGREKAVKTVALLGIPQTIYLLTARPDAMEARAAKREGTGRWPVENLLGEAQNVADLVRRLSTTYDIPITVIDVSSDLPEHWIRSKP